MTKKEKIYLENLEECFEQLQYAYESAHNEIKELKENTEVLEKLCQEHFIKIPELGEPF